MAKPTRMFSRHTGFQDAFGIRRDFDPRGYCEQATLGCIDAPTYMAGGSVHVDVYRTMIWAAERGIAREA